MAASYIASPADSDNALIDHYTRGVFSWSPLQRPYRNLVLWKLNLADGSLVVRSGHAKRSLGVYCGYASREDLDRCTKVISQLLVNRVLVVSPRRERPNRFSLRQPLPPKEVLALGRLIGNATMIGGNDS